jgi:hypothetical protein
MPRPFQTIPVLIRVQSSVSIKWLSVSCLHSRACARHSRYFSIYGFGPRRGSPGLIAHRALGGPLDVR